MSSSGSESDWSEGESDSSEASVVTSEFESVADRLRRNDESLTRVENFRFDVIEILDALKANTVVKKLTFSDPSTLNQEAVDRLSEVMKFNKSVESFTIYLGTELLRERLVTTIATSGGWSSIQELALFDQFVCISLREIEHLSRFII